MALEFDIQTIIIFIGFIAAVLIAQKLFSTLIKSFIAGAAGFSFPWMIQFLSEQGMSLPFQVTPSIETGIYFGTLAFLVFLAFEFLGLIIKTVKLILSPLKLIGGKK